MKKKEIPELSLKQIETHMNTPLVKELCDFIERNYKAKPKFDYSWCQMKPGWNIKYKKSNKSICVIYPMDTYFTCLITVIDSTNLTNTISKSSDYLKNLYIKTDYFNGTKWLMIDVTNKEVLEEVKNLIITKMEN